jgi:hypothetical protein
MRSEPLFTKRSDPSAESARVDDPDVVTEGAERLAVHIERQELAVPRAIRARCARHKKDHRRLLGYSQAIISRARAIPYLDDFPNLRRWFDSVRSRPGTQRAYARGEPYSSRPAVTEEGKRILFGQTATRASVA